KYSEKFKYIHIDEFQDVNDIQYKIVKLLYKNHKNIFAVGDDDQSIYGFRGANVKNILNFTSDFEGVKVYKLEQNYRSTKKILSLANAIISKNTGRADKKLWCDKEDGVRIEYKSLYNETEEGSFVANAIKSLITYSGYSYSDIAVLYRMNSLSRSIEQEFLKYNIPCKVYGGQKFYERKEIKDLTAYIRAVCNVKDNEALKRIINVPKRGIGDTTVEKLNKICIEENLYLYELLQGIEKRTEFNAGTKQKLVNFRNMLFLLMAKKQVDSPENFVKDVINYSEFMVQFADNSEENVSRRLNIEEFVSSVKEFSEDNPDSNIADFLQSITLSSAIDQTFENESAVSLATVHAVKGLEFKVVFIIGLDEKIFPILRNDTTPEDLEEERRLMYVAITRAMERLYLTRCETRYNYSVGERMTGIRSRFIEDVKDLLGLVDVKDNYDIEPAKEIFKGKIAIPQKPTPKKVAINAYSIGDKVEHKKFGQGVVVNVKGGGEDCVLDIAFKGFGVKTLVVKYAPIQKI
ncbi:MAG: UvrD-helicase domain-containing protein, partial [Clostridia bacterium]|nr:UvrD-helicase domain-containing protein [Clostridia bacterium]